MTPLALLATAATNQPAGDAANKSGGGVAKGEAGARFAALLGDIAEHSDAGGAPPATGRDGHSATPLRRPGRQVGDRAGPDEGGDHSHREAAMQAGSVPPVALGVATAPITALKSPLLAKARPEPPFDGAKPTEPLAIKVGRIRALVLEQATHFAPVGTPSLANSQPGVPADRPLSEDASPLAGKAIPSLPQATIAAEGAYPSVAGEAIQPAATSVAAAVISPRAIAPGSPAAKDPTTGGRDNDGLPTPEDAVADVGATKPSSGPNDAHVGNPPPRDAIDHGAVDSPVATTGPLLSLTPAAASVTVASPLRQIADAVKAAAAEPPPPTASVVAGAMSPVRTLTIELHPAELGVVTARLRLAGGVLSVKLSASRPATARLLKQQESPLKELLGADGHAVEIGDVDASSAGQQPNKPIGQSGDFGGGGLSPGNGWQPSTSGDPGPGNRQAYREPAEDDRSEPREGDRDPLSREHPDNIYV